MTTSAEEQVAAFLGGMASSLETPDVRVPKRVRRGTTRRMVGWGAMTALAAGAIPVVAVFALASLPGAQRPALGRGELIAFMRSGEDRSHRIWVMEPDGSEQRPVSPAGTDAFDASWSPDGERLVYVRDLGYADGSGGDWRLEILDVRSGDVETLPPPPSGSPSSAVWSPDGSTIAFVDAIPGDDPGTYAGSGLYLISPSGQGLRLLIDEVGSNISWSPDGREIVFERWVRNTSGDLSEAEHSVEGLWAVNVATRSHRQITDLDGDGPTLSPDGTLIAYSDGATAIWVVNADGTGGERPITDVPPDTGFAPEREVFGAQWSPDGTWISFCSDASRPGHHDLYKIHPDGTGLVQLMETPEYECGATWRPV
jgi:Tol biopolymer transport system component